MLNTHRTSDILLEVVVQVVLDILAAVEDRVDQYSFRLHHDHLSNEVDE